MKYLLKDLLTFRTGRIVNMTVWDSFDGKVKIIKNRCYKWLIEVIDVSMCYSCQRQLKPGERMWVYRKELFRDGYKYKTKSKRKKNTSFDDEDLPF
ncbi:MAG: hypothetical protein IKI97_12265 [Clostridia bacterium]|nr:hypothetical protein [Clostridia bacterium]